VESICTPKTKEADWLLSSRNGCFSATIRCRMEFQAFLNAR
jgi:hypothetical protein